MTHEFEAHMIHYITFTVSERYDTLHVLYFDNSGSSRTNCSAASSKERAFSDTKMPTRGNILRSQPGCKVDTPPPHSGQCRWNVISSGIRASRKLSGGSSPYFSELQDPRPLRYLLIFGSDSKLIGYC